MIATPPDPVCTMPVDDPTIATPVLPLTQVPPAVASYSVSNEVAQVVKPPMIGSGNGFTVTVALMLHPARSV